MIRTGNRLVPALMAFGIAVVSAGAGAGVYALTAPDPKPVVRTLVLDFPPACQEIRPAVQAERARAKAVSAAALAAEEEAAGRYVAELTKNEDTIAAAANRLDDANRAVQKAELQLGDAQVATDAAVNTCTPERPE